MTIHKPIIMQFQNINTKTTTHTHIYILNQYIQYKQNHRSDKRSIIDAMLQIKHVMFFLFSVVISNTKMRFPIGTKKKYTNDQAKKKE